MPKYLTENDLRRQLRKSTKGRTMTELAREIGVNLNFLSQVINGAPVTGKLLSYLGVKKVRIKFYEKV